MRAGGIAKLGLLTGTALILGYIEQLLPIFSSLPGVKLGLGNIAVLLALYSLDIKSALAVALLKAALCALLFSGAFSALFGLTGGLCALLAMALAMRLPGASVTGVSVVGAVFHNLGQCAVACALLGSGAVIAYLPALLFFGLLTGLLTGLIAKGALKALLGGGGGV